LYYKETPVCLVDRLKPDNGRKALLAHRRRTVATVTLLNKDQWFNGCFFVLLKKRRKKEKKY